MPEIPVDPSEPLADQQARALAELKKASALEYSQYVANGPIYVDGALAYVAGQAVPASNVDAHGYLDDGSVRRVGDPQPASDVVTPVPAQGDPIVIDPLPVQAADPVVIDPSPDVPAEVPVSKSSSDKSSANNQ